MAQVPTWTPSPNRGLLPVWVTALAVAVCLAQIWFATPGMGWQAKMRGHVLHLWYVGKAVEARRDMCQAIALNPLDAEAQRLLGMIAFSVGEEQTADGEREKAKNSYLEAQSALVRSLRLAPDLAESHYALGLMLKQMGNKTAAREEFQRCLDLTGARRDDLKRRAITKLAELGEYVAKPLPVSPIAGICKRGRDLLEKGRLDEARSFALQAIAEDATDPEAWDLYAQIYAERGEAIAAREAEAMAWAHSSDGQPRSP